MMNNMPVPEKIYMMAPAMYPVTGKIKRNKSDDIGQIGGFDMSNSEMFYQPTDKR